MPTLEGEGGGGGDVGRRRGEAGAAEGAAESGGPPSYTSPLPAAGVCLSDIFDATLSLTTGDDDSRHDQMGNSGPPRPQDIGTLRRELRRRDLEIQRLQAEIHKLRSVLQATGRLKNDGVLDSLHTAPGMAGQGQSNKKQGVSGESGALVNIEIKIHDKDFRAKQLIKTALLENDFLRNLEPGQMREIIDCMYPRLCVKGSYLIREGEVGSHLYVSASGDFEVVKNGEVLGKMGPGRAFGELAILYNCTRTASIRVLETGEVWVLDRRVFQNIMQRSGTQRREDSISFLRSVPILQPLNDELLSKIADSLQLEFYPGGHYIVRQGAPGDTFYILSGGNVKVTQKNSDGAEEEVRRLERGDYFGEQALLKEDRRTANVVALSPGVECLTLDRESFMLLIGDLCEFQDKDYGDKTRISRPPSRDSYTESDSERDELDLEDLDIVSTLGVGGFGRVELVKSKRGSVYALKCMKKCHIVQTHQISHVFSERDILFSVRSPFVCRLYQTFKDTKYVYLLMEPCLGGEVWSLLRDRTFFDDATACFITACVIEALSYLHRRNIIYRDLKPENLMLDSRGFVKMVDFGFAKKLPGSSSKTWTFCGTPEYVAPEVILNKGHDRAVDYWALGILMFELLTGMPPFTANDPMKIYNLILKGIDSIEFPRHITRTAQSLIKRLCRELPAERLGCHHGGIMDIKKHNIEFPRHITWTAQSLIKRLCRELPAERLGCHHGGIMDIKKHKWFQGFDWHGLAARTISPPIVPKLSGPTDTSNFDKYPKETDFPPDELSNWDQDF